MSNAGGCPFGIVMLADSLMEFFFFLWWLFGEGGWFKKLVRVIKMVVEICWEGGFS